MDLLQLKYFYTIATAPTLTQAASELHVSQPSLSKLIRNLEEEFGMKFFERSGRYLQLNQNGLIFLRHATAILNSVDEMRDELQGYHNRADLSLRVGLFAASALFPGIISGFRQEHPNVKISVVQHSFEHSAQDNFLDIIFYSGLNPPDYPNSIRLAEEELLLAVPNTHSLATQDSVPLAELKDERFISMSKGKSLRTIADHYCEEAGIQPHIVLESDDPAMLRNLIQSGFGVSFVPAKTWMAFMQGDIHLLHISEPRCLRFLYITMPRGAYQSTAARLFQHYLVRYFEQM